MCSDFGPDRLRFAGLIPESVQKNNNLKAYIDRLSAYNQEYVKPLSNMDYKFGFSGVGPWAAPVSIVHCGAV